MRRIAVTLALLVAAFAGVTWWALESGGVATIETRRADGSTRSTHVWWIESSGQLWLEAGSPTNGWYVDVGKRPLVNLSRGGESEEYVALPAPDALDHDWIRSEIRSKYGFRDWWVNLIVDTSESVAVRMMPPDHMISGE